MHVSEARIAANQLNARRSTGPRTELGRSISSRNSLKHGLSGSGLVVPEGDREEVERRVEDLTLDMKPMSPAGAILIRKMALFSVRSERAAEQESAQIGMNVRHAADDFDEGRIETAERLFQALRENPRTNLRKLRKSPEGVERLIDEWSDLRADLGIHPQPSWTAAHLERVASLLGMKAEHARSSLFGALSMGSWGDFTLLGPDEGGGLADDDRREWSRARLVKAIDDEIAALEAHYETLDFETLAIDRAEAGVRARFDPSKSASLARRYESEAHRGFYQALQEFRRVEAESEAVATTSTPPPAPTLPEPTMASSRDLAPPTDRDRPRSVPDASRVGSSPSKGPDGQANRSIPPLQSPG